MSDVDRALSLADQSDRFRIWQGSNRAWFLSYPRGYFADSARWSIHGTFENAVRTFVVASERQCPTCLRGAVEDRDWGWECTACGQYDVAMGCTRPPESYPKRGPMSEPVDVELRP